MPTGTTSARGLWILAVFVISLYASTRFLRPLLRQPARGPDGSGLTNAELAYLADGPERVLQLVLAELVQKGMVVPDVPSRSLVLLRDRIGPLDGLAEQMVSSHQLLAGPSSNVVNYNKLIRHCSRFMSFNPLLATLQVQQLALRGWANLLTETAVGGVALGVVVWVLSGVLGGVASSHLAALFDTPVLAASFTGLSLGLDFGSGRTIWGDKVLEQHQAVRAHNDPLRRVALLGPSAMTGGRLDGLLALIEGVAADDTASSCACGC
jgi:uncharacterized protein (TIGR04222 family)